MSEFVNQWVGGMERLRWAHMEKPLRAAQGSKAPEYPRNASQSTPPIQCRPGQAHTIALAAFPVTHAIICVQT
jgi:hypothetical protein